jgi:hypothetical protein
MDIEILLAGIDRAFDRKSWHGPNLRGSLRGVDIKTAAWRPAPGKHNIWEIVLHAAYWKYVAKRRLTGEKRGSFPLKGSNFFQRPLADSDDASQWRSDVALLTDMHRDLRTAIEALGPTDLSKPAPGGSETILDLVLGIAAHDLYHAGQIQLLKRLQQTSDRTRA